MHDNKKAALIGLLVGDALGVPYEFHLPDSIPPLDEIEFSPPKGFRRSHAGVPPGTWSDDGAQALCLLASLQAKDGLDTEDLGSRMVAWRNTGYLAVDGRVFDVGGTTEAALRNIERGQVAIEAGLVHEQSNGNGSLMRVLPLALWHQGSDQALVDDAIAQSRVTHGHIVSVLCCAIYCLWARRILESHSSPWDDAVATLRAIMQDDASALAALDGPIDVGRAASGQGTGYVVDCLHSARVCLQSGSYETVVRSAVALGNDTDTTAAVAGGLAGLRDGMEAIPLRWRQGLRGRDILDPLLSF